MGAVRADPSARNAGSAFAQWDIDSKWLRRCWLAALVIAACWLAYCASVSLFAPMYLERLAKDHGVEASVSTASSWYPGELRVFGTQVSLNLNGASCAASAERLDVEFRPFDDFAGMPHIRTLDVNDAELDCDDLGKLRTPVLSFALASDSRFNANASITDARIWAGRIQPATWHGDSGARLEFSDGAEGTLRLGPSLELIAHWHATSISYQGEELKAALEALDMGWEKSPDSAARAVLLAQRASVRWLDTQIQVPRMLFTAADPHASHPSNLRERSGSQLEPPAQQTYSLSLRNGKVTRGERGSGQFDADLELYSREQEAGLRGSLEAEGDDAGIALMLARLDRLPSWIESKFVQEAFTLNANVKTFPRGVELHDIRLDRGAIKLRGWWHVRPGSHRGALLMQYGGLTMGIDALGGAPVVMPVAPASEPWLESRAADSPSP